jgi:diguanylate cyclase (GGDEF)-like protein
LEARMPVKDFFLEPLMPVISYTVILVILALMLVVSIRLFSSRRKKAYLSMTISLIFLILQYLVSFVMEASGRDSGIVVYFSSLLKAISFILVNVGVFQLYNRTSKRQSLFFNGLIVLGILISLLYFYVISRYEVVTDQVLILAQTGIEIYIFMLILFFSYLIPPMIGQRGRFHLALMIYLVTDGTHLLNMFIFHSKQSFLLAAEHILPIVFYFLLFLILFERVVELMQAIYNSSITDGLTSLYNRKYFYARVSQYVQRHIPVYVLFSDIDNFKKLNDTKGHQVGDDVLRAVADIMQKESEDVGIAGRYGGEEMVVLVTDPSVNIAQFTERIRDSVEKQTIVTISIGFSQYTKGVTPDQLIKQADEAMYRAKTSGKNKVMRFGA